MKSLVVENLPAQITVPELAALFRPYGWVTRADIWKAGVAAGGEVDLAWGGDWAARDLDGTAYRGQKLVVRGKVYATPAAAAGGGI